VVEFNAMLVCQMCQKGVRTVAYSRHKKGSSGAGGTWALRAPIHKRLQKPNLHKFHGMTLCSKCLKTMKKTFKPQAKTVETVAETPASA